MLVFVLSISIVVQAVGHVLLAHASNRRWQKGFGETFARAEEARHAAFRYGYMVGRLSVAKGASIPDSPDAWQLLQTSPFVALGMALDPKEESGG